MRGAVGTLRGLSAAPRFLSSRGQTQKARITRPALPRALSSFVAGWVGPRLLLLPDKPGLEHHRGYRTATAPGRARSGHCY